jgi:hypothetical protein
MFCFEPDNQGDCCPLDPGHKARDDNFGVPVRPGGCLKTPRKQAKKRVIAIALAAFAASLLGPFLSTSAQDKQPEETPEQYPAHANRDDTFYFCTACHSFKIIAQQGMSRGRWNDTIDYMIERHKMVDPGDELREQILDYLSTAFPERRAPGGWRNPFETR